MIRFVPAACFRILFLVGIFCFFNAAATHPSVTTVAKLDWALTQEELRDPAKVAAMRTLLVRLEDGRQSLHWIYVGTANVCLSLVGLYSLRPARLAEARIAASSAN